MAEMVTVRSVKNYFNEFIVAPVQKMGVEWLSRNYLMVKEQLIEAFRKEIFGQIIFKLGPQAATVSPEELTSTEEIRNILQQAFRKWRRLCMLCGDLGIHFLGVEDLEKVMEERNVEPVSEETPQTEDV